MEESSTSTSLTMDNPETIRLSYSENCTTEEGQQKKRKQKKRSERQVERARRYREKLYGNGNTENNLCSESPKKPTIANTDFPHSYPSQPHVQNQGFNIASARVLNQRTYCETSLMVTAEEYIHNTEKYQSSGADTNQVVRGEHFEHDPENYVQWSEDNSLLVNNNLPYGMQTATGQMYGLNISGTRRSQPNTTDVVKAKPKRKKKRNRSAKQIERARRYREGKYGCDNIRDNEKLLGSDSNPTNSSGKLSDKQPSQPTIHILSFDEPSATIHHIFCTELLSPEKYINRENIKALISNECSKFQDESEVGTNNALDKTNKSTEPEANLVDTIGEFATNAEKCVKWSDGEIAPEDILLPENNHLLYETSKLTDDLEKYSAESVSDTEDITPVRHTLLSEYGDHGMYGILGIYMNSGLHGHFDSTAEHVEKTSTDGSKDFGYEYFSFSNL